MAKAQPVRGSRIVYMSNCYRCAGVCAAGHEVLLENLFVDFSGMLEQISSIPQLI